MTPFTVRPVTVAAANLLGLSLFLSLITTGLGQGAPGQYPEEELEKNQDPPALLWRTGASPRMISRIGAFTSVQVNVNAQGQNITGDAANETCITVDPTNHNRMAIGWRQFDSVLSNFRQGGWGFTNDGGETWTFPGVLENGVFRSDPVLKAADTGNFYYLSLLGTLLDDMWRSTNGGESWTNVGPAEGGDKQWFTIDNTDSPGHGFQYQSWSISGDPFGTRQFTRSTDGGLTWMNPINIPHGVSWGTLDVDSNGNLFIGGMDFSTGFIWCVRSSNARNGTVTPTFDLTTRVDLGGSIGFSTPINPDGLSGQVFLAADHTGTATNNNVYLLASVLPASGGGTDVMFARSSDGGQTFSAPVRINDDPINPEKWHWFGTLAVAPNGRIDAIWLDSRNAANNTDSQLFYSFSMDGGNTWAPNVAVSNSFNPFLGYPDQNKMGDYITIVSDNTGGDVAYAATFNGEEDAYYVRVSPNAGGDLTLDRAASILEGFGVDLPLTGPSGIESRGGSPRGVYDLAFVFNNNLASVANVTASCGVIQSSTIDGTDLRRFKVKIRAGNCNPGEITITLTGITDDQSNTLASASATVDLHVGDVNADGVVNATDINRTRADAGQTTDASNFREDINVSGSIDRQDLQLVRRSVGTSVP